MAETSGFFQAMWDESLTNPITQEETGWWDRNYLAKNFMDYFSLFVGNGVFASPTNQLMVQAGTGRAITITPGWAYINGAWYHNDAELTLPIATNASATNRIDSIRLRYSEADRKIVAMALSGETGVIRGDSIYDLELARITVLPAAVTIRTADITDMRSNEEVCGFVTGLLEVVTTKDLFAQFTAIFNDWFNEVRDQVTGDLAIKLQKEFVELNKKVEDYQKNTEKLINEFESTVNKKVGDIEEVANSAKNTIQEFVDKDFVIAKQSLTFSNGVCTIVDSRVTADSLVDVYFTKESTPAAEAATIYVDSEAGKIILTATTQPTTALEAVIRVRVR